MKRVITAIVLLVIITVSGIVWLYAIHHQLQPLQDLAAQAEKHYLDGDAEKALQTATQLTEEYTHRTRHMDLFIPHAALLEAEKSVNSLPLILQYGEPKDFVAEARRCQLLLRRLWEQEIPKWNHIL